MTDQANRIYRYHVDCGRMGDLSGLFVVNAYGEECLRALIESSRDLYFGEVLGKHSEVYGPLEAEEIELVEATAEDIKTMIRVFKLSLDDGFAVISGYCPLVPAINSCDADDIALFDWCCDRETDPEE